MKTIKTTTKNTKRELNNVVKSPLFWLHTYNKCAKKNTAFDGVKRENIANMVKRANKLTGKGCTFALLPQNSNGQICKLTKVTAKNYKGNEIITTYLGDYEMIPIAPTNYKTGLIDAVMSYLDYYDNVYNDLLRPKNKSVHKNGRLRWSLSLHFDVVAATSICMF